MGFLKKFLLVLVVLFVLFLGVGFLLPRVAHVDRSITIEAPQRSVFALVESYRRFNEWSPWHALEPDAKVTLEGPQRGVGAKMSWEGKKLGTGSQQIVEARAPQFVRSTLDFGKQGTAVATFLLEPAGKGTKVTWGFQSDLGNNPIARYFGVFMNKMLGSSYEQGLAGLKKIAEALPKSDFASLAVETIDVKPVPIAYLPSTSSKDPAAIGVAIGKAYAQIGSFLKQNKLQMAGAPLTIDKKWGETYEFDAAVPVDRTPEGVPPADAAVKVRSSYGGPVLKVVHVGAYKDMSATFDKLVAYAAAYGYEKNGDCWEEYVSDPGNTPEAELKTNLYMPVK